MFKPIKKRYIALLLMLLLGLIAWVFIAPVKDPSFSSLSDSSRQKQIPSKPATASNPNRNLYFGDVHIHSSYSSDAFVMGVRAMPDDAYIFAKGGTIRHANGTFIGIDRPLDFAAVTDHAEYLGMMRTNPVDVPLTDRSLAEVVDGRNKLSLTLDFLATVMRIAGHGFKPDVLSSEAATHAWQEIIDSAERHNQPGAFTTFIGFEWSSQPDGANLHRNVIFRGRQVPETPFSAVDSEDPEDLWRFLEKQQAKGKDSIAIPHNSNLSTGLMYSSKTFSGAEFTPEYARLRTRFEPVSEIFQVKGASETNPILSAEDEFADFEIYQVSMSKEGRVGPSEGSYIRDAMRRGLEYSRTKGFNPFKFGVIGSSDGHNASSPVDEDAYHGKLPMMDGSAGLRLNEALLLPKGYNRAVHWGSGGLVAVWATENTRESLFDAMRARETYATSGTRIRVRFFAGWELPADLLEHPAPEVMAYEKGVPMGAELPARAEGKHKGEDEDQDQDKQSAAPRFAVWAMQDPERAHLDRIQIIKGWVDAKGQSHEKIYDVVAADNRKPDPVTGKLPPVGNTVDLSNATYSNSIGAGQLATLWTDPDFDPVEEAFYYVRVLEIPTPRWSTFDAIKLGIAPPAPATLQERAVTSAIWYTPE